MNGLTTAAFFAKLSPLNWLAMIILIVALIVGGGQTYYAVKANTEINAKQEESLTALNETMIIMVEEMQDMNETMDQWMEKLFAKAFEENTSEETR